MKLWERKLSIRGVNLLILQIQLQNQKNCDYEIQDITRLKTIYH